MRAWMAAMMVAAAAMLAMHAAAGEPASTSGPATRPHASSKRAASAPVVGKLTNREDQATVLESPSGTVVYITSPKGIGGATLTAQAWPAKIAIRLRYSSERPFARLEGFASQIFPAAGGEAVTLEHRIQNDAQGLVIQIDLPASLRSGRVQMSWVDAYR